MRRRREDDDGDGMLIWQIAIVLVGWLAFSESHADDFGLRPLVPGEDVSDCGVRKRLLGEAVEVERGKARFAAAIGDVGASAAAAARADRMTDAWLNLRCDRNGSPSPGLPDYLTSTSQSPPAATLR